MKRPLDPSWPPFAREAIEDAGEDTRDEGDPRLVEVVANLGAGLAPRRAPARGRERLLAAVRRAPLRYAPFYEKLMGLFDLDEPSLVAVLQASSDRAAWEAYLPGVQAFHLAAGPRVQGADAGLVRIDAGLKFPEHRHLGPERVLLLEGSYRDSSGVVYRAGDVQEMSKDTLHSYEVSAAAPAVLAVLLYGGLALAVH